jgi:hypothetical protein
VRLLGWARRRPILAVTVSYVFFGAGALAPSIRPGRTLVAADLLRLVSPYSVGRGGGPPGRNPMLSDAPFQFFPWFRFVTDALGHGHVPGWNPAILGGVPTLPTGYLSPWYPPSWAAALLPPLVGYNLFVLAHLVFAAIGVYALSRVVGARRLAAWAVGLATFASAFWVHWSTHLVHLVAFAWLPWALAAVHRLVVAPSPRGAVVAGLVLAMWGLGGNPQYVYDGALVVAAYAAALLVVRRLRREGPLARPMLALGAAAALGLGLAAPVLLPSASPPMAILRTRERAAPDAHVPRSEAIRALVPDAVGSPPDDVYFGSNDELRMDSPFLGIAVVVLVGAALANGLRRDRMLLVLGLAGVAVLAYTTTVHRALFDVAPGYDRFRAVPMRWFSVLPALALPLAALGLDDLLARRRRALAGAVATAAASVVAVVGWLVWVRSHAGAPDSFFTLRAVIAVALVVVAAGGAVLAGVVVAGRRRVAVGVGLLLACVTFDVAMNTSRWFPRVAVDRAYPKVTVASIAAARGGRVVRVGPQTFFPPFSPDLGLLYGVDDVDGITTLFPRDYDRYLRLVDDYGPYATIFNGAPPLGDANRLGSPLLDALDVRTVVADPTVAVPAGYQRLDAGPPAVYARTSAGAAVVVPRADPVSEAEMWRRVAAPGWDPKASASAVGLRAPVVGGPGAVTGGRRGTDGERWSVDAPAGGFLRVSGNWTKGWSARVDGHDARVLRADGIFRGVTLGPGRHVVEFSFANPAEHRGLVVAAAAAVLAAGVAVLGGRRGYSSFWSHGGGGRRGRGGWR